MKTNQRILSMLIKIFRHSKVKMELTINYSCVRICNLTSLRKKSFYFVVLQEKPNQYLLLINDNRKFIYSLPDLVAFISKIFSNNSVDNWKQDSRETVMVDPVAMMTESLKSPCVSAVISRVFELSLMMIRSEHFPGFTSNIPNC